MASGSNFSAIQHIYGTTAMQSKNFEKHQWLNNVDEVVDPYKSLPPVFDNPEAEKFREYLMDDDIQQGGAAMMAYGSLQFMNMSDEERVLTS